MNNSLIHGNTIRALLEIAVPVFLTQLVQQLFVTIDSVIVGRYVGATGLAAIGVTYQIILFTVSLGIGFLMGISVMTGEYAGACDEKGIRKTIAVSVIFVLMTYAVKLIIAIFFTDKILMLTNTPYDVLREGSRYLSIMFIFGLFTYGYSMCTYVLRALGDAVRPMYFLLGSSIMNIVLDVLFVGRLGLGVSGAAYATVISESCAMLGCVIYIRKMRPYLIIGLSDFKEIGTTLRYALKLSVPSSLQMCAVTMSSILVQAAVNSYGTDIVAGLTAAQKVEQLFTLLVTATGTALMTFVTQNRGAGASDRVRSGLKLTLIINIVMAAVVTGLIVLTGPDMLSVFISNSEDKRLAVISAGMQYFRYTAGFYVIMGISQTLSNYLRGMADAAAPLWIGAVQVAVNISAILILEPVFGICGIWASVPLGWAISSIAAVIRVGFRTKPGVKQLDH